MQLRLASDELLAGDTEGIATEARGRQFRPDDPLAQEADEASAVEGPLLDGCVFR